MGATGEISLKWVPRSVADTVDGEASQPGAMTSLQNLLWDPSTPHTLICRPANTVEIDFSTYPYSSPGAFGVITTSFQVGDIVYGLVGVTSGTYNGLDFPFAYNTVTQAFITVSSITTAKCPTSQATTGEWVPPQMTLTGIDLVVTHVGFSGMTYYFGYFDVTTPTSPAWHAGNTSTNGLPSVPQACQQFNNRTYFACGNLLYYTDTLALTMTASNQSLAIDDYTNVTALAPLPVSTTSQAILQGVLAFKLNKIYLITGDAATMNLGSNQISPSVGTAAPRSVVPTPDGVKFMAVDGIRTITFWGALGEPDDDLAMPFIYAVHPTRVCAAFNSNIYRICTQNGNKPGSPYEDYWYDFRRKGWTGPHTFQYDIAIPLDNDFVVASNSIIGKMWNSFSVQAHANLGSTFVENGNQLSWAYQPAPMTDLDNIYANALLRTTIDIASPASGQTYTFTAENESGTLLAQGSVMVTTNQAVWGSFNWGASNWGAATSGLVPLTIPWNQAIVFNKVTINAIGVSALGFKIGRLHLGYKRLNYLLN